MKVKVCPKCGCSTTLSERWAGKGRKLQQYCRGADDEYCGWTGDLYVPPKRPITNTKNIMLDNFHGWNYIIYDKYGHKTCISRTYDTKKEAMNEFKEDLYEGIRDKDGGPYIGVLFKIPVYIKLKGKMYKVKNGVVTQVNI